jgi:hypothetical protein
LVHPPWLQRFLCFVSVSFVIIFPLHPPQFIHSRQKRQQAEVVVSGGVGLEKHTSTENAIPPLWYWHWKYGRLGQIGVAV